MDVTNILNFIRKNKYLLASGVAFSYATLHLVRVNKKDANKAKDPFAYKSVVKEGKHDIVNRSFLIKVQKLINIAIPGWCSPETRKLLIFSCFLIARTYLSILISDVNGRIVKSIIEINIKNFIKSILTLAMFAVPASTINSMLKFLSSKLALCYRSRLVEHFNRLYLLPLMSYRVTNVDSRITNPDQILTSTISEQSNELSTLYSDITKPLLDIILFSVRLTKLLGFHGPLSAIVYYIATAYLFRILSPSFGRLIARSQELEGTFRRLHNRLITYCEEIAFYSGHNKEKLTLNNAYKDIEHHKSFVLDKEFYSGLLHGYLTKYGSFVLAYSVLGLPVFGPRSQQYIAQTRGDSALITADYIRNSNLYISLAQAIGKIVVSYGKIQKLAGYTSLIFKLEQVFSDLSKGKYVRQMTKQELLKSKKLIPRFDAVEQRRQSHNKNISIDNLTIVTPNGDILVENITLEIVDGMNFMISGPNGCGKSSLFRILSELQPVFGGRVLKPDNTDMFYIPQRPYLTKGTLRDQIIYPHSFNNFCHKSNDEELLKLLELVQCSHLVLKKDGVAFNEQDISSGTSIIDALNEERDQLEVLSGGEKQQIAMARLMYHRPRFAIMDECTSAISMELEAFMYTHCKKIGINLITVSHRPSLWKYHSHLLKFDGRGNQNFGLMNDQSLLKSSSQQHSHQKQIHKQLNIDKKDI